MQEHRLTWRKQNEMKKQYELVLIVRLIRMHTRTQMLLPLERLPLDIIVSHEFDNLFLCFPTISVGCSKRREVKKNKCYKIIHVSKIDLGKYVIRVSFSLLPKWAATWQDACFSSRHRLYCCTSKETMVFYALFPKVFTFVSRFEEKFNCVLVIALQKEKHMLFSGQTFPKNLLWKWNIRIPLDAISPETAFV